MLKGLFDRPMNADVVTSRRPIIDLPVTQHTDLTPYIPDGTDCDDGYHYDQYSGFCVPNDSTTPPVNPITTTVNGGGPGTGGTTTVGTSGSVIANVNVSNAITVTDEGIQQVADAVSKGITDSVKQVQDIVDATEKKIQSTITEETDVIKGGIEAASTNLGDEVKITTAALAASTAATVGTVGESISGLVGKVKDTIVPVLTSITGFIDKLNAQVQLINDTLISPIAELYNSTIGSISALTTAIEADLHEGIGGLLKIPGQLADQLGSFDAQLNRTVAQLGTLNKQTVTESIDYLGLAFPKPFSEAMNTALSGKTLANSLTTTFGGNVALNSESLSRVSADAIKGLGTLLKELLGIVSETFKGSLDNMHANWGSVESVFVGLLDGALSLLTTITAMGALAGPLIEAAEEEAHALVPITKLDPASVIEALKRGILSTQDALKELRTKGIDATRSQVLIDLGIFLADANQALDWWYRGIITDIDLIKNLEAHGFQTEDITAYKEGSISLPQLTDLLRWLNFGIISEPQLRENARVLRYSDAFVDATLASYRDRETPQTLSILSGLLETSDASFINETLKKPVPSNIELAGQRAGYHPDLTRYIWLNHWQLPPVETFMQLYFRGIRTLTELQQRMQIANIPHELWDDLIKANRSLIPYRSIPSFVSKGYMTASQADLELEAHGFDLQHREIILKAIKPAPDPTTAPVIAAVHTLSQQNARTLWSEGAITDEQYIQVLEAHGYDAATAALQLKSDLVTEHIKAQKQELADLTAQVLSGVMTIDDAVIQLSTDGFTQAQQSKFTLNITKQQKITAKIPSLPELNKFLKAELITLDQYTDALKQSGWQEPWLSAFLGLVSKDGQVAGSTGATAA